MKCWKTVGNLGGIINKWQISSRTHTQKMITVTWQPNQTYKWTINHQKSIDGTHRERVRDTNTEELQEHKWPKFF